MIVTDQGARGDKSAFNEKHKCLYNLTLKLIPSFTFYVLYIGSNNQDVERLMITYTDFVIFFWR